MGTVPSSRTNYSLREADFTNGPERPRPVLERVGLDLVVPVAEEVFPLGVAPREVDQHLHLRVRVRRLPAVPVGHQHQEAPVRQRVAELPGPPAVEAVDVVVPKDAPAHIWGRW